MQDEQQSIGSDRSRYNTSKHTDIAVYKCWIWISQVVVAHLEIITSSSGKVTIVTLVR